LKITLSYPAVFSTDIPFYPDVIHLKLEGETKREREVGLHSRSVDGKRKSWKK
jgi:hypothetical protein